MLVVESGLTIHKVTVVGRQMKHIDQMAGGLVEMMINNGH